MKRIINRGPLIALVWLLVSCAALQTAPAPSPVPLPTASPAPVPSRTPAPSPTPALTEDERATLNSLQKVEDEYPLYVMHYIGPYRGEPALNGTGVLPGLTLFSDQESCARTLGCSLFAALGDPENRLYGRNLQADYGPGLLLFTDPADGYASVSMVNLKWLALVGDRSENLKDRTLTELQMLLFAPAVPFDGMNEKGLAIGMASIDSGGSHAHPDPQKKSISEFGIMREVLDHAATVQEAVDLMGSYNINMAGMPFHYLIASTEGNSALVEIYKGEMVVLWNEEPWQAATNFLVASKPPGSDGGCGRYSTLKYQLQEAEGRLSSKQGLDLLALVTEANTRWRVLYHMTTGDLDVVMGSWSGAKPHQFHLEQDQKAPD